MGKAFLQHNLSQKLSKEMQFFKKIKTLKNCRNFLTHSFPSNPQTLLLLPLKLL